MISFHLADLNKAARLWLIVACSTLTSSALTSSAWASTAILSATELPIEGTLPALSGGGPWLNSPALSAAGLRGKVVMVDFWTYSCINCRHTLPYVKAWAEKYKRFGLVVIGVHTPEFAYEKDPGNVRQAMMTLGVQYPVVLDNDYSIWRAFNNSYWPAYYFADSQGRIRHHHFGEGDYADTEHVIQQLLRNAGQSNVPSSVVTIADSPGWF